MRNALVVAAFGLIALAVFALRPTYVAGPAMRDFEAYWSAGATLNAHADPYGRAIWNAERTVPGVDARHEELLPFVGPPPTLAVWSALARLPWAAASRLWGTTIVLASFGLILAALRGAGATLTFSEFLTGLALAIGFGPATSDLALGQVAVVAFFGAAFAATAMPAGAKGLGAFLASLQPNVSLGLISQLGRNRTTVALAAGVLAAYLAGVWTAGWQWPASYLALLLQHQIAERFSAIQMTPGAIAHGLGAPDVVAVLVSASWVLTAIAAAGLLCARVREPFARFAACSALVPFVSTFFHEHDLIVAFPAVVFCAVRARGAARGIALFATLLVAVDWAGLAQRPTGIAQSACLAVAAALAFVAFGWDAEGLRALAVPVLCGAALFAAAAFVAVQHPMPVWPTHLDAFTPLPGDSAAAVWSEEQTASGLLAVVPVWAALRALPLLGCACLAALPGVRRD
ncbi:MAG: hypothetical protein JO199_12190 [Candidatus Eremiobacteraeota bacterium]|nr:hypothetical protein [Candidatus Eremiobacteraeota bacterium]